VSEMINRILFFIREWSATFPVYFPILPYFCNAMDSLIIRYAVYFRLFSIKRRREERVAGDGEK
jgi:hypothetical protein